MCNQSGKAALVLMPTLSPLLDGDVDVGYNGGFVTG